MLCMQVFSRAMRRGGRVMGCTLATAFSLASGAAAAQDAVADFYRGKSINMIVGYSSGGGYDIYARAVARHMGKHIPGNPKVVVNNMPGAGSLVSLNYLYNVAPKDGTAIATFGRGLVMEPLIGSAKVQYDATKVTWIGSASNELSVCAVTAKSKVETFEETLKTEVAVGGEGSGSDPDTYALLVRNLLGSKMKLVTGYPGGNDMTLAIERGELDGRCGWSWGSIKATRPDWAAGPNKLRILLAMTLDRSPDMPDVPTVLEKARSESEREIIKLIVSRQVVARPFAAPPSIPADRRDALRAAFDATMKDPEFLTEAKALSLEIAPIDGANVDKLVQELYRTPAEVVTRAKALIAAAPGSAPPKH
ncbi:MAG: family tricarboxylate transporter, receptor protein [Hyphomicrobiales bacterium]|nr:family tricarboxylate transporter, receptor protein [Hyphomicrobiales bacterium]